MVSLIERIRIKYITIPIPGPTKPCPERRGLLQYMDTLRKPYAMTGRVSLGQSVTLICEARLILVFMLQMV